MRLPIYESVVEALGDPFAVRGEVIRDEPEQDEEKKTPARRPRSRKTVVQQGD